jgi:predicted nucleotidyltransferase
VRRIVAVAAPERIVLFGSRARSDHRPDSDIDVLVITESDEPRYARSGGLYTALAGLPREVDADIVVYTPAEIHEWTGAPRSFITSAVREGGVLHEKR